MKLLLAYKYLATKRTAAAQRDLSLTSPPDAHAYKASSSPRLRVTTVDSSNRLIVFHSTTSNKNTTPMIESPSKAKKPSSHPVAAGSSRTIASLVGKRFQVRWDMSDGGSKWFDATVKSCSSDKSEAVIVYEDEQSYLLEDHGEIQWLPIPSARTATAQGQQQERTATTTAQKVTGASSNKNKERTLPRTNKCKNNKTVNNAADNDDADEQQVGIPSQPFFRKERDVVVERPLSLATTTHDLSDQDSCSIKSPTSTSTSSTSTTTGNVIKHCSSAVAKKRKAENERNDPLPSFCVKVGPHPTKKQKWEMPQLVHSCTTEKCHGKGPTKEKEDDAKEKDQPNQKMTPETSEGVE